MALGDDPICPVSALKNYMSVRPSTSGSHPLVVTKRRVPISPKVFNAMLRLVGDDPICPATALKDFIGRRPDSKGSHNICEQKRGSDNT